MCVHKPGCDHTAGGVEHLSVGGCGDARCRDGAAWDGRCLGHDPGADVQRAGAFVVAVDEDPFGVGDSEHGGLPA